MIAPWSKEVVGKLPTLFMASAAAWVTTFFVFPICIAIFGPLGLNMEDSASIMRDVDDPRMSYVMFASHFVNAFLLGIVMLCLRESIVNFKTKNKMLAGAGFGALLWATQAAHGMVIDYCLYKEDLGTAVLMLIGTFVNTLLQGSILGYFLF